MAAAIALRAGKLLTPSSCSRSRALSDSSVSPSTACDSSASPHAPSPSVSSHRRTSPGFHKTAFPYSRLSKSSKSGSTPGPPPSSPPGAFSLSRVPSPLALLASPRPASPSAPDFASSSAGAGRSVSITRAPRTTAAAKHTTGTTVLRVANTVPPVAKNMNPREGRTKPKIIRGRKRKNAEAPTVAKTTAGITIERLESANFKATAEAKAPAVHTVATPVMSAGTGLSPTQRTIRRRTRRS
mmetsp:Transcript_46688/g.74693  ORF Transcript_46688/g.74693 Transcript_46688/m.74693 type:complete len:241 (+) Transcript_46688:276-998(+)